MTGGTGFFVFQNGKFFQSKTDASGKTATRESFAEALVVEGGIITFIGNATSEVVQAAQAAGAEVLDLQGRVVLPGFIDGHIHLLLLGQALQKLPLDACKNINDIRRTISQYAAANPNIPRLFCRGWQHPMTPDGASASMLDGVDPRPIFITSKDLHFTWMNAAALAELSLDDQPDPPGGKIERDPSSGRPSGVISDAANRIYMRPFLNRISTEDDRISAMKVAIDEYCRAGYTGFIDMGMQEDAWDTIQGLRRREKAVGRVLPARIAAYFMILPRNNHKEHIEQVERVAQLAAQYNTENDPDCRVVGIKLVCDGIVDACTASLNEPYSHNGDNAELFWPPEFLGPVIEAATKHGLQVAAHAIGDRTVTTVVDALERYGDPALRHRIEHLELTKPEDAVRLGKLGITASVQPVHSDPAILTAWPHLIGETRCQRAFAYREFADGGALMAIGTDSPTAPHEPLRNTYVATTRRSAREPDLETVVNPDFALTLCEAVSGATEGAAKSCFAESRVGSLEVGKRADFIVVDMEWEKTGLLKAQVLETWFDGIRVYSASQSQV